MTAPAEMPGLEEFGAAEPDMATDLATKIMALDWMDRRKWTCESQADRHGELQEMIDAAFAPILAEKERLDFEVARLAIEADRNEVGWNAALARALAAEAERDGYKLALVAEKEAERERCAKIVEEYRTEIWGSSAPRVALSEAIRRAAAIRAQS